VLDVLLDKEEEMENLLPTLSSAII